MNLENMFRQLDNLLTINIGYPQPFSILFSEKTELIFLNNNIIQLGDKKGISINGGGDATIQYYSEIPKIIEELKGHVDKNGFINSYNFISKLSKTFKEDQIVTTDAGTALLSGHQAITLKKNQRIMTSTGLGEMGYGLPAAIGASFGKNKGEIIWETIILILMKSGKKNGLNLKFMNLIKISFF